MICEGSVTCYHTHDLQSGCLHCVLRSLHVAALRANVNVRGKLKQRATTTATTTKKTKFCPSKWIIFSIHIFSVFLLKQKVNDMLGLQICSRHKQVLFYFYLNLWSSFIIYLICFHLLLPFGLFLCSAVHPGRLHEPCSSKDLKTPHRCLL